MDLLLTALCLYLWQSVVQLPWNGLAFAAGRSLGGPVRRGPGFYLLSPWPGDLTLVTARLPFDIGAREIIVPEPRGGGDASAVDERAFGLDGPGGLRAIEVRGSNVVCDGELVVRGVTPANGHYLASIVSRLTEAPSNKRLEALHEIIDASFDTAKLDKAFAAALRTVRPLRWSCALSLMLTMGTLTVFASAPEGETWLLRMLLPLAVVHLACVVSLIYAESRGESRSPNRGERLLIAALYPPALWRAPSEWFSDQLALFHPAAIAGVALGRKERLELVRHELAELDYPRWARFRGDEPSSAKDRAAFTEIVRSELVQLLERDGQEVLPNRQRTDVVAASYCPLCLDDFRASFRYCPGCGVETVTYEPEP